MFFYIFNIAKRNFANKNLVITGRDIDNFGIIFNNEFLSKKIPLKAMVNENEIYNIENVFSQLIAALKNA